MAPLTKLSSVLSRFKKSEDGSATVEFVMLIPVVMWIVFSVVEAGWLMTQQTLLNRGLNLAVRELRLGRNPNPTPEDIKASICSFAGILRDCNNVLTLELVEVSNPIGGANAVCVDRTSDIAPVVAFNAGSHANQDIMVARACFVVDPLIPGAGLGALLPKDASGAFHLVSYSAFVNEPEAGL